MDFEYNTEKRMNYGSLKKRDELSAQVTCVSEAEIRKAGVF